MRLKVDEHSMLLKQNELEHHARDFRWQRRNVMPSVSVQDTPEDDLASWNDPAQCPWYYTQRIPAESEIV